MLYARILESIKANMASILGYFGSLRWDGEGLTVPLYSIVSRLEVSYRIRLDFKCQTPRKYPTALVDLDSDFMPLGPQRIPKMALVEQMKPFWDSRSSGNTNM